MSQIHKLRIICCIAFSIVQIYAVSEARSADLLGYGSRAATRLVDFARNAASVARETVVDGFRTASTIGRLGLLLPSRLANLRVQSTRNTNVNPAEGGPYSRYSGSSGYAGYVGENSLGNSPATVVHGFDVPVTAKLPQNSGEIGSSAKPINDGQQNVAASDVTSPSNGEMSDESKEMLNRILQFTNQEKVARGDLKIVDGIAVLPEEPPWKWQMHHHPNSPNNLGNFMFRIG